MHTITIDYDSYRKFSDTNNVRKYIAKTIKEVMKTPNRDFRIRKEYAFRSGHVQIKFDSDMTTINEEIEVPFFNFQVQDDCILFKFYSIKKNEYQSILMFFDQEHSSGKVPLHFGVEFLQNETWYLKDDGSIKEGAYMIAYIVFYAFSKIQEKSLKSKRKFITLKSRSLENTKHESNKNREKVYHKKPVKISSGIYYKYEESTRTYERHVESWFVRGHYRTYKSGKTVFIEGHYRGSQKGDMNNDGRYEITL